jgi:hypothetical protein
LYGHFIKATNDMSCRSWTKLICVDILMNF